MLFQNHIWWSHSVTSSIIYVQYLCLYVLYIINAWFCTMWVYFWYKHNLHVSGCNCIEIVPGITGLIVHQSSGMWGETIIGCFGVQCTLCCTAKQRTGHRAQVQAVKCFFPCSCSSSEFDLHPGWWSGWCQPIFTAALTVHCGLFFSCLVAGPD